MSVITMVASSPSFGGPCKRGGSHHPSPLTSAAYCSRLRSPLPLQPHTVPDTIISHACMAVCGALQARLYRPVWTTGQAVPAGRRIRTEAWCAGATWQHHMCAWPLRQRSRGGAGMQHLDGHLRRAGDGGVRALWLLRAVQRLLAAAASQRSAAGALGEAATGSPCASGIMPVRAQAGEPPSERLAAAATAAVSTALRGRQLHRQRAARCGEGGAVRWQWLTRQGERVGVRRTSGAGWPQTHAATRGSQCGVSGLLAASACELSR
jgi:hypothetical protein